jgi:hypothetical protein
MILWKLCRRGHELRPENVYFGTGTNGPFSQCLVCKRDANQKYEKTRKRPRRHRRYIKQLNLQIRRVAYDKH